MEIWSSTYKYCINILLTLRKKGYTNYNKANL